MPRTGLKRWSGALGYYLFTGLLVSGLAFINQYPLVYSDTGAYLENAFSLSPYDDRPIGYGLIIRAFSWQSTLWPVVIFQGLMASWLLMLLVREVIPDKGRWITVHLFLLALLILSSSLPWYAAQLMADIYTPFVLLIAFLLFRGRLLGPVRETVLWLLLFFFLATHNSHLPMAAVLSGLILVRHLWKTGASALNRFRDQRHFWFRWGTFNLVALGAVGMVSSFNYAAHGRFQLSRAGNVFLVGRLCEPGIVADYMRTACEHGHNPFCAYKDHLPADAGDLLWSPDQFVQKEGLTIGQADSILAPMVGDILSRPEYLARFARSSLTSTFVQLFQWEAGGGLHAYAEDTSPHYSVARKLKDERYRYDHARQQWGYWADWERANRFGGIALLLSVLVLALLWFRPRRPALEKLYSLSYWVVTWVVLNAFVTATFAIVDPRLQSRVMWLLPLCAFLIIVRSGPIKAYLQNGSPEAEKPV
ncbi:MAG: hypothetical protein KF843_07960 [Flavobacteriales bacterium]|nr:hypothetical protein [Flavobacteriales bacterium]